MALALNRQPRLKRHRLSVWSTETWAKANARRREDWKVLHNRALRSTISNRSASREAPGDAESPLRVDLTSLAIRPRSFLPAPRFPKTPQSGRRSAASQMAGRDTTRARRADRPSD